MLSAMATKNLTARWRTETYGEVNDSLEKRYLKEIIHLAYPDMSECIANMIDCVAE